MNNRRRIPYIYWVIFFFILLGLIPILLYKENQFVVKIFGVFLVVSIVAALWYWRIQTRRNSPRNQRIKLSINDRFWLNDHIPFYANLKKSDRIIFENRVGIFLADTPMVEEGKDIPEKETCFYVGASAIIAFWGFSYWDFGVLEKVLINPFGKHGVCENGVFQLSYGQLKSDFKNDITQESPAQNALFDSENYCQTDAHKEVWSEIVILTLEETDLKELSNKNDFFSELHWLYAEKEDCFSSLYPKLYSFLNKKF